MLSNEEVVAFAATATPETSREFYEEVLELALVADEPTALVFACENATVRIAKTDHVDPPPYTVLGWVVGDIDEVVATLTAAGVELIRYDELPQDDRGIASFGDGTRVAWFSDPDGNTLSVTEHGSD